jgi:predicted translin family RNA/ssDNA-binding protein
MNKSNPGNCNEKQELDLPLLRSCRDYRKLENVFDRELQEYFEAQLLKYLYSKETTVESLERVPLVICWCEGMLTTEEFINELEYNYANRNIAKQQCSF